MCTEVRSKGVENRDSCNISKYILCNHRTTEF